MPAEHLALLLVAAFAGGALNAAAGGGSFLVLPALVFTGVPPVMANATGTTALLPGYVAGTWGFREDLQAPAGVSFTTLSITSIVAGALGAALLLMTGDAAFDALLPWLLLVATLLFACSPLLQRVAASRTAGGLSRTGSIAALGAVSLYGGYFNGGLGILLLATLQLLGEKNLNTMNGIKGLVSVLLTTVSVAVYAAGDLVLWPQAIIMMFGAVAGGYAGARVIRRLPATWVRGGIVATGFTMTVLFFIQG